jgi:hypothetical protein
MSNAFIGTLFVGENRQHAGSILEQRTVEKSSDPGDNGSLLGLAVFRQEDFRKADQRLWIDGQRQVGHTVRGSFAGPLVKSTYVKLTGNAQTGQVESRPKPLLRLADYTLKWISAAKCAQ